MRRNLALLIALLLLAGCGLRQTTARREAGAPAVVQRADGLSLRATAGGWPEGVEPADGLVAFRVEIANGSSATIDLRRDDFELVTPTGATLRPVAPMQLFGEVEPAANIDPVAFAEPPFESDEASSENAVVSASHRRVVRRSVTPVWRSPSYPRWATPYPPYYASSPTYGYRSGYGYGYTPWMGPRVYVSPYGRSSRYAPPTRREVAPRTPGEFAASGLGATTDPLFASVLRDAMLRPKGVVVATLYFATDSDASGTYRLRWLPRHAMSAEAETTMELTFASAE